MGYQYELEATLYMNGLHDHGLSVPWYNPLGFKRESAPGENGLSVPKYNPLGFKTILRPIRNIAVIYGAVGAILLVINQANYCKARGIC